MFCVILRDNFLGDHMKHTLKTHFENNSGFAIPSFEHATTQPDELFHRRLTKRGTDLLICFFLIPLILPIVLLLALFVRRDGGPAFFGHTRVGRDGEQFKCWKIRSMVPDAQQKLDTLLAQDPAANAQWMRERKLDDDPRITRLGDFLRKSSLDELPQLLNVVRGEMSLVGPRPVPRDELDQNYGQSRWVYLKMRPGVTGLWQVSGRNDVSYDERVQMDVDYYKSASLGLDLGIIARTGMAVLNRTGK